MSILPSLSELSLILQQVIYSIMRCRLYLIFFLDCSACADKLTVLPWSTNVESRITARSVLMSLEMIDCRCPTEITCGRFWAFFCWRWRKRCCCWLGWVSDGLWLWWTVLGAGDVISSFVLQFVTLCVDSLRVCLRFCLDLAFKDSSTKKHSWGCIAGFSFNSSVKRLYWSSLLF